MKETRKYSRNFGEMLKEISNDEDASDLDLFYCLTELSKIGEYMNNGELQEEDVDFVFNAHGISNEVMQNILDKFLTKLSEKITKEKEEK